MCDGETVTVCWMRRCSYAVTNVIIQLLQYY